MTFREAVVLTWGKVRRGFLVAFRKRKVEETLNRRRGACNRCGYSCKILFRCPAYDDSDGVPKCLIYNDRPGVCGLFPLDERDLRELEILMPKGKKCGYWFDGPAVPQEAPRPEARPIRWGPPREPGGKKKNGTFAIIKAFFKKPRG